jgi:predicted flavoprotein YhiN
MLNDINVGYIGGAVALEGSDGQIESDGRVFPKSDDANCVAGALRKAALRAGVHLVERADVVSVKAVAESDAINTDSESRPDVARCDSSEPAPSLSRETAAGGGPMTEFEVTMLARAPVGVAATAAREKRAETLRCGAVILATGSAPRGYEIAASFGHGMRTPFPSLFSLRIPEGQADGVSPLAELAGISLPDVRVTLELDADHAGAVSGGRASGTARSRQHGSEDLTQRGAMLVTHRGVSGPAILRLSSFAAKQLHDAKYRGMPQTCFRKVPLNNQSGMLNGINEEMMKGINI